MENETIIQIQRQIDDLTREVRKLTELFNKNNFSNLRIENKDVAFKGGKIGFFSTTPVTQPSSTGETSGASDLALNNATTFTGNFGTKAYTVLDIVKHLKTIGILKKD